jgi:tetratricopeptide (TPR) repeat protein
MIFHDQNDFIQAAEYFSKVIEDKKVDSKTRFRAANNAAVAYQKTSSWLDAARLYTIVLSDYPDIIHVSSYHLKIGFCLLQASKVEEAYEHFKKANINPQKEDKPEILYWVATCYSKMGEFSKAIAEFLKVPYLYAGVGISKWGVTAEYEAARLYERLGEYTKAVTLYRKIVQSDGEQGRFGKQALSRIQRLSALVGEKK